MPRNSFIQMSKLTNVSGRINYITSKAKQENLYATYATTSEIGFWRELAKYNQAEFMKSGTDGKCIEARELIIALPESFVHYNSEYLLKRFTDYFKQNFQSSFQKAVAGLQNYFNVESVGKTYIDELVRRFNSFLAGRATDNSLGFEAKV